jgi:dTDP-4-amino-4,6-dideoxygalactose transaminase
LLSNRPRDAVRARFLASQARDPEPHYEHSEIGFNYRLSNLLAAVGRAQLRHLDEKIERRRVTRAYYMDKLRDVPGISFMPEPSYGRSNAWLTCVLVDPEEFGAGRERIRLHLEKENIEARPVWKPMHLQPAYAACRTRGGSVAAALFDRGLCLPSGSSLGEPDRQRVMSAFLTSRGNPTFAESASHVAS